MIVESVGPFDKLGVLFVDNISPGLVETRCLISGLVEAILRHFIGLVIFELAIWRMANCKVLSSMLEDQVMFVDDVIGVYNSWIDELISVT